MDYLDMANKSKKPALKPFDTLTKLGPYSENGYVIIPDNFPTDYTDDFYQDIDTEPVHGLSISGYISELDGEQIWLRLDQKPYFDDKELSDYDLKGIEAMKQKSIKVIGFDDAHITKNEMGAKEGAEYLAEQLKTFNEEAE